MLIRIPQVIPTERLPEIRARLDAAQWIDGNVTSGHQSAQAKYNEQLPEDSRTAQEIGQFILSSLARNQLFFSAALPKEIFPPLFNRYREGMTFGTHGPSGVRIRTDCSVTLFLTPPEDYDGGELLIEDAYGTQRVKLPAGDLVMYPSTSLHRVTPVTRGARVSSFFWLQSMVRDDAQRTMLFDLDMAIIKLTADLRQHDALVSLTGSYHNLLRMWAEP
jgi:PKHD-type hydroxylase